MLILSHDRAVIRNVLDPRRERLIQISYVLAGVYADTPNPEELVKEEHRQKAQALLTAVEEADCSALTTLFTTVGDEGNSID